MSTERIDVEALRGHTPGPWLVRIGDEWTNSIVTDHGELPDGSRNQWEVASYNLRRDEGRVNARLIAAAPSLLAEVIERRARDAELIADLRQAIDDVKIVRRVDGDGMEFGSIRKLDDVERSLAAAIAAIQGAQP